MKKVVLYSMKNCPHCDSVQQYFKQQAIPYRLCNVKTPAGQKEFRRLGFRGVPVVKISDQYLTDFSIKKFNALYR